MAAECGFISVLESDWLDLNTRLKISTRKPVKNHQTLPPQAEGDLQCDWLVRLVKWIKIMQSHLSVLTAQQSINIDNYAFELFS